MEKRRNCSLGAISPLFKEQFLLFSTIFCYPSLDFHVKTGSRISLRHKRLFEISEFEITRVNCSSYVPAVRHGSEDLCCTILTKMSGLEVRVTDLEIKKKLKCFAKVFRGKTRSRRATLFCGSSYLWTNKKKKICEYPLIWSYAFKSR